MKCPRDNVEVKLVEEHMALEIYKFPECGMKITLEEDEE